MGYFYSEVEDMAAGPFSGGDRFEQGVSNECGEANQRDARSQMASLIPKYNCLSQLGDF
jgi:hypothetical protein